MSHFSVLSATAISLCLWGMLQAQPQTDRQASISTMDGRSSLAVLNFLIGDWRGVGQPRRGSNVGAWTETASCVWDFRQAAPSIVLVADKGRQFESLRFFPDKTGQTIVLEQKLPSGVLTYNAARPTEPGSKIVLHSVADEQQTVYRCTVQQLNDIRVTILFEKQTSPAGSFRRTAEIGYTRSGQRLAIAGASQRQCIVTGGLGTIPVTHEGRTYYVCCQGCVQAFQEAPAEIIADYQASLKKAATDQSPNLRP